jgi:hypothetical protein
MGSAQRLSIEANLEEHQMSEQSNTPNSETIELPTELRELAAAIQLLPLESQEAIGPALNRVVDSTRRRRHILTMVQDALGQLRLDMKYLVFDLEATRRERDDYRRQLEQA